MGKKRSWGSSTLLSKSTTHTREELRLEGDRLKQDPVLDPEATSLMITRKRERPKDQLGGGEVTAG